MKKISEVIIDDFNCTWLDYPIHLKDFDKEARKNFKKDFWLSRLNNWIVVREKKGHGFKVRLIQKRDGKLCPEVQKSQEPLINFHAGILFSALKELSRH